MRKYVYRGKYCANERRNFRICLVEITGKCPGIYSINLVLKCKSGFFIFSRSVPRGLKDFLVTGQQHPHILLLTELISRSRIHHYRTVITAPSARIKQSPIPVAVRSKT